MANQGGQGQPGLAPLSQDPPQPQPPPPPQPQQGPPHQMPQPSQPMPQQGSYQGNYAHQPVVNGKQHQFLQITRSIIPRCSETHRSLFPGYGSQSSMASPGPGKPRNNIGPRGHASTPQQSQPMPYPGNSPPPMGRNSPPPPQYPNVGNMLAELNPDEVRADQKREGIDWYAVFNPNVRRVLDIELVCNLGHESVVCCVRFSHDGSRVATGCNRSAQIFDVRTGEKITTLQDETVDKDGDLYIRSVCFSPDGRYLATGAEDKQIRVSCHFDDDCRLTKRLRSGTLTAAIFFTPSLAMSKTFIPSTLRRTDHTSLRAAGTILSAFGTSLEVGKR